ncbi:hypothetical protein PSHT_04299 [Puccinia striiformis]|uniref:Uncharacterized protein n=1 Tax=Puccinia striiformis TaxID=27350 RepID=A0A2S4WDA6_9BASI|nr:hypothetical protein PSHT_04299 [Puccinia striiformis]
MYPDFSFLGHSVLCYFTCGIALAHPAFPDAGVEGFFGFEHESGQGDLFEVYNQGKSLNRKRPPDQSQSAPSRSLVEAQCTDIGGHHSYQDPVNSLMPLPDGQKRQKAGSGAYDGATLMSGFESTHANPYQTFMPPGLPDGIQLYVDNMSGYPGGSPWESHENPNHEGLLFAKGPYLSPLNPSLGGASDYDAQVNLMVNNPEAYWLSGVNMEHGGTGSEWHVPMDQLDFNTFPEMSVAEEAHMGVIGHSKTQHLSQFPDPSIGKGSLTPGSSQHFTPTQITHKALEHLTSKNANRIQNQKNKAQEGVNVIPIASDEEVEQYLKNIHLPRRRMDMSNQFLEGFIIRFRRKLSEVSISGGYGSWSNLNLNGKSIVRISQNSATGLYVIRVLDYYHTQQDEPKVQRIPPMFWMFVRLIEWLLLINKLVLINIVEQHMIGYLINHSTPGGNILPVLGFVQEITGKEFGPIQEILSNYLSKALKYNDPLGTAISIISYYYGKIPIGNLKGVRNLDDNLLLEKSLKWLIYQGIEPKLVIDDPTLRVDNLPSQFGNFRIHPLSNFPKIMRPGDTRTWVKVDINKEEEEIVKYLDGFLLGCTVNHKKQNLEADNLPVSLRNLVYDEEQKFSEGDALVTINKKCFFKRKQILNKIKKLIVYLKACHIGLEEKFQQDGRCEKVMNQQKFYEWFRDLLATQKENDLPIFGHFVVEDRDFLNNPPSSSDYSAIQIWLISYFGDLLPDEEIIRFSLSLIGYFHWFRDKQHQENAHPFQNGDDYWNTVIRTLRGRFMNESRHSLISFFPEVELNRKHTNVS